MDLQRQNYYYLTDSQKKVLMKKCLKVNLNSYSRTDSKFISDLVKEEVLIKVPINTVLFFPELSDEFYNSSLISNSIIDLNLHNFKFSERIVNSLNNLGCLHLELRIFKDVTLNHLNHFFVLLDDTTIEFVDIFVEYAEFKRSDLTLLKKKYKELRWIYVCNTPQEKFKRINNSRPANILYLVQSFDSINCGNVTPFYFSVNIPTYTESKKFNSCLNCKISIDANGKIKNCPSMNNHYGHISNTNLETVINNTNFSSVQDIRKDDIMVCKDCEFRYMCTDCRAFIEDPLNIYSKPLKCGYDPYLGEWTRWDENTKKVEVYRQYVKLINN